MLLSRVAENLYWGARYLERAEDTARIIRTYSEAMVDLPMSVGTSWEPLLAITGSRSTFDLEHDRADEAAIVRFLVADDAHPGSVVMSIGQARENLRSAREVMPRDGWRVVNDLYLFAQAHRYDGVGRRSRGRFLERVVADVRLVDGILASTMSRDAAYEFFRLGQAVERADMTTRVLGVRAAALMAAADAGDAADEHAEVQWMSMLASLSARQMYHRTTREAVNGAAVVRFLLLDESFPRSILACLRWIAAGLDHLPRGEEVLPAVGGVEAELRLVDPAEIDGKSLDAAMDAVQLALAALHDQLAATYLRSPAPLRQQHQHQG
jgi:uncharacterized alpha-E superfamily protein